MSKVTLVEPQKKNPRRFNVFLDGKFAFGADEDLIVERRLVVGKEIPSEDLEKLLFEAEVGKLMERMYGLVSIRQRSEKEIRDYLRNLSFKRKVKDKEELSDITVESLIAKLKQKGLINDAQFAKDWTEARGKKKGWRAIQAELSQKGVSREIQASIRYQVVSSKNEEVVATSLLEKKLKSWRNLEKFDFKKKAYEFLMRKGFEYSIVAAVVEKTLKKEYNSAITGDFEE